MKTFKDVLVKDRMASGNLTPENGKSYNYALGEPKYYTAYKVNEIALLNMIKEWIKFLEKESRQIITDYPQGFFQAQILRKIFNLEVYINE